jgi:eukaryotic-like serine/threonine-protein kinase
LALCGRRWLKPFALPDGVNVSTLQRLDDTRWLVAGRSRDQGGFAAIYSPLQLSATMLSLPPVRAMIGGASLAERASALLVGSGGFGLSFRGDVAKPFQIPGEPDLSTGALDIFEREWVASRGVLWSREGDAEPWKAMWRAPEWQAPFISMMADVGIVTAMTADGAIVEGRVSRRSSSPA